MSPCEHLGIYLPLEATGISLLVSVLRETFSLGREFGWILLSLILLPHSFLKLWCGSLDLESGEGSMVQEGGKSPHPRSHWGLVSCSLGLDGV